MARQSPEVRGNKLTKANRVWILRRMRELVEQGWTHGTWQKPVSNKSRGVKLADGKRYQFCIRGAALQAFVERFGLDALDPNNIDTSLSAEITDALSIEALARAKSSHSAMELNDNPTYRRRAGLPGRGREAMIMLVDEKLAAEGVEV